jgi:ankyrin repeat protein
MDQETLNLHLRHSANFGKTERCLTLLREGADVNTEDAWENTALHNAIRKGHLDICKILLDHGASLGAKRFGALTPFEFAVYHGQIEIVDYFIDVHDMPLDELTHAGETLDQLAGRMSQEKMVRHLMIRRSQSSTSEISAALSTAATGYDCLAEDSTAPSVKAKRCLQSVL